MRSTLWVASLGWVLCGLLAPPRLHAQLLNYMAPQKFTWDALVKKAEDQAKLPYVLPISPGAAVADKINYDEMVKIQYRSEDHAMFLETNSPYTVSFVPLAQQFKKRVRIFRLENGSARELKYSHDYFNMPSDSPALDLPADSGFAGFEIKEDRARDSHWYYHNWASFIGASYFRTIGELNQFGISARGIAIDTAETTPEEFPDFTEFYIQPAANPADPVVVYAYLDGPSITGAYKFELKRGSAVVTDVENVLFMRKAVKRLGIAPLTSMYWYGEMNREKGVDWRPEIHDSDGLAIWNGNGEQVFRPLVNPTVVTAHAFVDKDPKGFGLVQRDRNPEHYLDGVMYEHRPTAWIEPLGSWGEGSVQLIEIPTDDEIYDNIGMMWVPKEKTQPGQRLSYKYRIHWTANLPLLAPEIGRVVATRGGRGGKPGVVPRPADRFKFVIEFEGGKLSNWPGHKNMEVGTKVDLTSGTVSDIYVDQIPGTKRWRLRFDVEAKNVDLVDLRAALLLDGEQVTETWLYPYQPPTTILPPSQVIPK